MNRKRIVILIGALILSALIVWHDLPLEFPGTMFKVVMLFVKLSVLFVVASFLYIFAGRKKQSS